jgi:hypothetical protein
MDLGAVIDMSWAQLDTFARSAEAAAAAAAPARLCPAATEAHACQGYACPHVIADDSGGYVCQFTGVTFGRQIMNGPLDNRLWVAPAYFPATKRKRCTRTVTPLEEVYSTCSQVVRRLFGTAIRLRTDEDRLNKALKSAARRATSLRAASPCALRLMYQLFAEVERSGALVVARTPSEDQLERVVHLLTGVYSAVVSPYAQVDKHRPVTAYYALAMCYLLSTKALGPSLHVPLLAAIMPEEKSLKHMDFSVTRMTAAKRYILAAVKFHVGGLAPP